MAAPDRAVNLAEKFAAIREHWSPKIVGELNDHQIKLAKVQGEFVWHSHDATDELFLVHSGRLTIELRNAEAVALGPGEFFIVPKGVEHRPVAGSECEILLFEPINVVNTGERADSDLTAQDEWI